jgi:hypothetical protein
MAGPRILGDVASGTTLFAVSSLSRRWMRLARLLVACLGFVLARPAPTVPSVLDGIVLVSSANATSEANQSTSEAVSSSASRAAPRTRAAHPLWRDDVGALAQLQSARALVARKYLRHCSLRC